MAEWKEFECPGCGGKQDIAPGGKYMECDGCGSPHCLTESGACKVGGCSGWLQEVENPS